MTTRGNRWRPWGDQEPVRSHRGRRSRAFSPFPVLVAAVLGVVLAVISPSCGSGGDAGPEVGGAAEQLRGAVIEPEPDVRDVALPVVGGGEPLAMRAEPGGLLLVYFGYTSCPDVCPLTMSDLGFVLDELLSAEDAARVQVAMATIDPVRDTDELLARYVSSFVPDGTPLRTEDDAELRAAADAFGASYGVEPGEDGDPEVTHSGTLYAVDDSGHIVVQWLFGTPAEDVAADLELLLAARSNT